MRLYAQQTNAGRKRQCKFDQFNDIIDLRNADKLRKLSAKGSHSSVHVSDDYGDIEYMCSVSWEN